MYVCIPVSVGVHMAHCVYMYVVVTGQPQVSILALTLRQGLLLFATSTPGAWPGNFQVPVFAICLTMDTE